METNKHAIMKPVLVTEVSDDIRALRGSDVEQQQTVLSARAIADCMAGDAISYSNTSDQKYYTNGSESNSKIDCNLVVDGGCRFLAKGSHINGPAYAIDTGSTGDSEAYSGFLYTFAVLPTGELVWGPTRQKKGTVNGGRAFADPEDGECERENDIAVGTIIRQVFWSHNVNDDSPNDLSNTDAYTRIGKWTEEAETGYPDPHYKWGDWALLSGERLHIIVTDPSISEVQNPIINAVYHVYTSISNFTLPQADAYRYGDSITIIQYPDPNEENRALWSTYVTYDYNDADKGISESLSIMCTPCPNRNTAKKEAAYLDGLSPTTYEFEIIPLIDESTKEVLGRSWELNAQAEETEFTTGVAELLDSHTESGINDIVNYWNRKYYEDSAVYPQRATAALEINRSMTASGYVVGEVQKKSDSLAGNWTVTVKAVASDTDANFEVTTDTNPSSTKMYFVYNEANYLASTGYVADAVYYRYDSSSRLYRVLDITSAAKYASAIAAYGTLYIRDGGCYQLAIDAYDSSKEAGYLSRFVTGTTYYELSSGHEAEEIFRIQGSDMQNGDVRRFKQYLNRHDIVYVVIKPASSQTHRSVRDGQLASVVVKIVPDPHQGSYLTTTTLNPSAYTAMQLEQLKRHNIVPENDGSTSETIPTSAASVINAYDAIARNLQSKGLMFGSVDLGTIEYDVLDVTTGTGLYVATPKLLGGYPDGLQLAQFNLSVVDNRTAPANLTSEEDMYFFTEDEEPGFVLTTDEYYQAGKLYFEYVGGVYERLSVVVGDPVTGTVYNNKVYYYYDNASASFVKAGGTTGYITSFESIYEPYYELDESRQIAETGNIIQTLTQFGTIPGIWTRQKTYSTSTWTPWVKHEVGTVKRITSEDTIDAATLTSLLAQGNPLVISTLTTGSDLKIHFPDPSVIPPGAKLRFIAPGKIDTASARYVRFYAYGGSTPSRSVAISNVAGYSVEFVVENVNGDWLMSYREYQKI